MFWSFWKGYFKESYLQGSDQPVENMPHQLMKPSDDDIKNFEEYDIKLL